MTFAPAVRVSLVCSDAAERRRLEPLVELVRAVIDAALARGIAGTAQLGDPSPPPCPRCAPLASELAETLRQLDTAYEREAELLESLRAWNQAAAAALDGRDEVRP